MGGLNSKPTPTRKITSSPNDPLTKLLLAPPSGAKHGHTQSSKEQLYQQLHCALLHGSDVNHLESSLPLFLAPCLEGSTDLTVLRLLLRHGACLTLTADPKDPKLIVHSYLLSKRIDIPAMQLLLANGLLLPHIPHHHPLFEYYQLYNPNDANSTKATMEPHENWIPLTLCSWFGPFYPHYSLAQLTQFYQAQSYPPILYQTPSHRLDVSQQGTGRHNIIISLWQLWTEMLLAVIRYGRKHQHGPIRRRNDGNQPAKGDNHGDATSDNLTYDLCMDVLQLKTALFGQCFHLRSDTLQPIQPLSSQSISHFDQDLFNSELEHILYYLDDGKRTSLDAILSSYDDWIQRHQHRTIYDGENADDHDGFLDNPHPTSRQQILFALQHMPFSLGLLFPEFHLPPLSRDNNQTGVESHSAPFSTEANPPPSHLFCPAQANIIFDKLATIVGPYYSCKTSHKHTNDKLHRWPSVLKQDTHHFHLFDVAIPSPTWLWWILLQTPVGYDKEDLDILFAYPFEAGHSVSSLVPAVSQPIASSVSSDAEDSPQRDVTSSSTAALLSSSSSSSSSSSGMQYSILSSTRYHTLLYTNSNITLHLPTELNDEEHTIHKPGVTPISQIDEKQYWHHYHPFMVGCLKQWDMDTLHYLLPYEIITAAVADPQKNDVHPQTLCKQRQGCSQPGNTFPPYTKINFQDLYGRTMLMYLIACGYTLLTSAQIDRLQQHLEVGTGAGQPAPGSSIPLSIPRSLTPVANTNTSQADTSSASPPRSDYPQGLVTLFDIFIQHPDLDVDVRDAFGNNILHYVATSNLTVFTLEHIQIILHRSKDPLGLLEHWNMSYFTPLHALIASVNYHAATIVQWILKTYPSISLLAIPSLAINTRRLITNGMPVELPPVIAFDPQTAMPDLQLITASQSEKLHSQSHHTNDTASAPTSQPTTGEVPDTDTVCVSIYDSYKYCKSIEETLNKREPEAMKSFGKSTIGMHAPRLQQYLYHPSSTKGKSIDMHVHVPSMFHTSKPSASNRYLSFLPSHTKGNPKDLYGSHEPLTVIPVLPLHPMLYCSWFLNCIVHPVNSAHANLMSTNCVRLIGTLLQHQHDKNNPDHTLSDLFVDTHAIQEIIELILASGKVNISGTYTEIVDKATAYMHFVDVVHTNMIRMAHRHPRSPVAQTITRTDQPSAGDASGTTSQTSQPTTPTHATASQAKSLASILRDIDHFFLDTTSPVSFTQTIRLDTSSSHHYPHHLQTNTTPTPTETTGGRQEGSYQQTRPLCTPQRYLYPLSSDKTCPLTIMNDYHTLLHASNCTYQYRGFDGPSSTNVLTDEDIEFLSMCFRLITPHLNWKDHTDSLISILARSPLHHRLFAVMLRSLYASQKFPPKIPNSLYSCFSQHGRISARQIWARVSWTSLLHRGVAGLFGHEAIIELYRAGAQQSALFFSGRSVFTQPTLASPFAGFQTLVSFLLGLPKSDPMNVLVSLANSSTYYPPIKIDGNSKVYALGKSDQILHPNGPHSSMYINPSYQYLSYLSITRYLPLLRFTNYHDHSHQLRSSDIQKSITGYRASMRTIYDQAYQTAIQISNNPLASVDGNQMLISLQNTIIDFNHVKQHVIPHSNHRFWTLLQSIFLLDHLYDPSLQATSPSTMAYQMPNHPQMQRFINSMTYTLPNHYLTASHVSHPNMPMLPHLQMVYAHRWARSLQQVAVPRNKSHAHRRWVHDDVNMKRTAFYQLLELTPNNQGLSIGQIFERGPIPIRLYLFWVYLNDHIKDQHLHLDDLNALDMNAGDTIDQPHILPASEQQKVSNAINAFSSLSLPQLFCRLMILSYCFNYPIHDYSIYLNQSDLVYPCGDRLGEFLHQVNSAYGISTAKHYTAIGMDTCTTTPLQWHTASDEMIPIYTILERILSHYSLFITHSPVYYAFISFLKTTLTMEDLIRWCPSMNIGIIDMLLTATTIETFVTQCFPYSYTFSPASLTPTTTTCSDPSQIGVNHELKQYNGIHEINSSMYATSFHHIIPDLPLVQGGNDDDGDDDGGFPLDDVDEYHDIMPIDDDSYYYDEDSALYHHSEPSLSNPNDPIDEAPPLETDTAETISEMPSQNEDLDQSTRREDSQSTIIKLLFHHSNQSSQDATDASIAQDNTSISSAEQTKFHCVSLDYYQLAQSIQYLHLRTLANYYASLGLTYEASMHSLHWKEVAKLFDIRDSGDYHPSPFPQRSQDELTTLDTVDYTLIHADHHLQSDPVPRGYQNTIKTKFPTPAQSLHDELEPWGMVRWVIDLYRPISTDYYRYHRFINREHITLLQDEYKIAPSSQPLVKDTVLTGSCGLVCTTSNYKCGLLYLLLDTHMLTVDDLMTLLAQEGLNTRAHNHIGQPLIFHAAMRLWSSNMLTLLLHTLHDINHQDMFSRTLLHYLLVARADIFAGDFFTYILSHFSQEISFDLVDCNNQSYFQFAAMYGLPTPVLQQLNNARCAMGVDFSGCFSYPWDDRCVNGDTSRITITHAIEVIKSALDHPSTQLPSPEGGLNDHGTVMCTIGTTHAVPRAVQQALRLLGGNPELLSAKKCGQTTPSILQLVLFLIRSHQISTVSNTIALPAKFLNNCGWPHLLASFGGSVLEPTTPQPKNLQINELHYMLSSYLFHNTEIYRNAYRMLLWLSSNHPSMFKSLIDTTHVEDQQQGRSHAESLHSQSPVVSTISLLDYTTLGMPLDLNLFVELLYTNDASITTVIPATPLLWSTRADKNASPPSLMIPALAEPASTFGFVTQSSDKLNRSTLTYMYYIVYRIGMYRLEYIRLYTNFILSLMQNEKTIVSLPPAETQDMESRGEFSQLDNEQDGDHSPSTWPPRLSDEATTVLRQYWNNPEAHVELFQLFDTVSFLCYSSQELEELQASLYLKQKEQNKHDKVSDDEDDNDDDGDEHKSSPNKSNPIVNTLSPLVSWQDHAYHEQYHFLFETFLIYAAKNPQTYPLFQFPVHLLPHLHYLFFNGFSPQSNISVAVMFRKRFVLSHGS